MPKAKVYNMEGQEVGEKELNPDIFGLPINEGLIHQAVVAQLAGSRQMLSHTKDRSQVRGGGRKPWKQKGTGRARHGSIRSPLWVGGGVTFGPTKDRNFSQKINKKAKRKALLMSLSDKVVNNNLILLEKFELAEIKTKKTAEVINNLPISKKILLVLAEKNEKIIKSVKNLPKVATIGADNLNVVDVLKNNFLVITLDSLSKIEKRY